MEYEDAGQCQSVCLKDWWEGKRIAALPRNGANKNLWEFFLFVILANMRYVLFSIYMYIYMCVWWYCCVYLILDKSGIVNIDFHKL